MSCSLVRLEIGPWHLISTETQVDIFDLAGGIKVPQAFVDRERRTSTKTIERIQGYLLDKHRFVPCDGGDAALSCLRLLPVSEVRRARSVVLDALRTDHLVSQQWTAKLLGQLVVASAVVCVGDASATIATCESAGGPSSAVMLVDSATTVKINHQAHSVVNNDLQCTGIEQATVQLKKIIFTCQSQSWILMRGPRGCGVSSTIRHLQGLPKTTVVTYSECAQPPAPSHGTSTVIIWIEDSSIFFDTGDHDLSAIKLRLMVAESNVRSWHRRWKRTVHTAEMKVFILTRASLQVSDDVAQMFDYVLNFGFPDVEMRTAILSSRFPEMAKSLAAVTVGRSRSELLNCPLEDLASSSQGRGGISWSRIAGLHEVKHQLKHAILLPRLHPERFVKFGLSPPRGVLLYGPPGCAKTSLVKALCSDQSLAFIYLDAAELMSAYVGESEQILRRTFLLASEKAPCVVFFDEVEIIGATRSSNGDNSRLLSTLLMELDGFSLLSDVCFVGATNMPQLLDSALLRPGRFDQLVYVPLPSEAERRELFKLFLGECDAVDLDAVASASTGFSGADVEGICRHLVGKLTSVASSLGDSPAPGSLTTEAVVTAVLAHPIIPYDTSGINSFRLHMSGSTLD